MTNIKIILLIGKTGGGKSTLANVITGTNDFAESAKSVSETKKVQERIFTENGTRYRIVDTVGVGDTGMSLDKVLRKLALTGHSVKDGLHQILFVTDGQLTKESKLTYDLLSRVVFDKNIADYTTIVRTRATWLSCLNYKEEDDKRTKEKCEEDYRKECEKDKKKISDDNEMFGKFIEACKGIVHVDNDNEKKREKSREILLKHLKSVCENEPYLPKNLVGLSKKIDEDEKKKKEIKKEKWLGKLKNKLINGEITEKMVKHIGELDPDLGRNIKKELKQLKDKEGKVADWKWFIPKNKEEEEIAEVLNSDEMYKHFKHIKEKCLKIFEKERNERIEELVDTKNGNEIGDALKVGIEVLLEIIKNNENIKSYRRSVIEFGKKVDTEKLEEVLSLQEELIKIPDEVDEEVLDSRCQEFERKYLKKGIDDNELHEESLKSLRGELKKLIIIRKAKKFLKNEEIFLKNRQDNVKELESCYNELNNFINREYTEKAVVIKLIDDIADAVDFDIKINPAKIGTALTTAQNECKKLSLYKEINKKFSSCLENDKNNISSFRKIYDSLKKDIYESKEPMISSKIIEILKLEDKTEEGNVKAFKPFNTTYETIYEIANDWKKEYLSLEDMKEKLNSLRDNLNGLEVDLERKENFISEVIKNNLCEEKIIAKIETSPK